MCTQVQVCDAVHSGAHRKLFCVEPQTRPAAREAGWALHMRNPRFPPGCPYNSRFARHRMCQFMVPPQIPMAYRYLDSVYATGPLDIAAPARTGPLVRAPDLMGIMMVRDPRLNPNKDKRKKTGNRRIAILNFSKVPDRRKS